jgi:hypothetical protein
VIISALWIKAETELGAIVDDVFNNRCGARVIENNTPSEI